MFLGVDRGKAELTERDNNFVIEVEIDNYILGCAWLGNWMVF